LSPAKTGGNGNGVRPSSKKEEEPKVVSAVEPKQ